MKRLLNDFTRYELVLGVIEKLLKTNNTVSKLQIMEQVGDLIVDHRDLNATLWQIWANHPTLDCDINFNTVSNPNKTSTDI